MFSRGGQVALAAFPECRGWDAAACQAAVGVVLMSALAIGKQQPAR